MSIESLLRKKAEQQKQFENEKPQPELVSTVADLHNTPNQPNIEYLPNQTNIEYLPNPTNSVHMLKSVSPSNDYAKVPNSIVRVAVPERYFKGMSKNTYDALYLKTRGAINPIRKIRATKSDLIRWAGVSDVTIDKHIRYLKSIGLLKVEFVIGSHEGNWYEVFIPEEIEAHLKPNQLNQPNILKKVGSKIPNLLGDVGGDESVENTGLITSPNTLLKTNTKSDDEPYGAMIEVFAKASEKVTGKSPNKSQQANWKELAELLAMELEIAAARTKSVSNAPAFLTEHLRRRLMPAKREVPKSKSNKASQAGARQPSEPLETYQAEALSEEGRESTLKTFIGYTEKGQKDFLMGLQDTYTSEDWEWLMNKLKAS